MNKLKELMNNNQYFKRYTVLFVLLVLIGIIIGTSNITYSRYETGVTSVPNDILDKLADFYGVSVDYILGRTDIRKPYKKRTVKDK